MNHFYKLLVLTFLVSLTSCSKLIWHTADAKYLRYEIGDDEDGSQELADIVAPYKEQLQAKMNIVIGTLDVELLKERVESNLGNWYTDIILEEANRVSAKEVDFALQNYGGLRSNSIAAGEIKVQTIYELMPFENTLVTVDIDGKKVKDLFDYIAAYGGSPVSKGVRFDIENKKAVNITINGEDLTPERIYRIALNDYVANGGDNSNVFKDAEIIEYDLLQRDALIQHIKRDSDLGIIQSAKKEGRIRKLD